MVVAINRPWHLQDLDAVEAICRPRHRAFPQGPRPQVWASVAQLATSTLAAAHPYALAALQDRHRHLVLLWLLHLVSVLLRPTALPLPLLLVSCPHLPGSAEPLQARRRQDFRVVEKMDVRGE